MEFKEAKVREDYSFDCEVASHYLEEIRNNEFDCHDEVDGEHIWGVAVLEIGNVDIELNLLNARHNKYGKELNEVYPCYFLCVKGCIPQKYPYPAEEEWESVCYLDDKFEVAVDWSRDDWKAKLEVDMFKKLMIVVKMFGLNIDTYNFTTETEREEMLKRCGWKVIK